MSMSKIKIKKRNNGDYYFTLHAPNSQIIAVSLDYRNKPSVLNAIASVKKYASEAEVIDNAE